MEKKLNGLKGGNDKMKKIAAALLSTLYLAGCSGKENKVSFTEKMDNFAASTNAQKTLEIRVSEQGVGPFKIVRYIDLDGDGKTVEQYLEFYSSNSFGMPDKISTNLAVSKDSRIYGGYRGDNFVLMSELDKERINSEYQSSLKLLNRSN